MVRKSRSEKPKPHNAGPIRQAEANPSLVIDEGSGEMDLDSAPSTTTKSLELVEWRDANFARDEDDDWDGDYICATVGWTEQEDEWLRITSEITPGGERALTRVPLVNVVQRKSLVIVNLPSTWTTSQGPTE